jgi:hypothetical protein
VAEKDARIYVIGAYGSSEEKGGSVDGLVDKPDPGE